MLEFLKTYSLEELITFMKKHFSEEMIKDVFVHNAEDVPAVRKFFEERLAKEAITLLFGDFKKKVCSGCICQLYFNSGDNNVLQEILNCFVALRLHQHIFICISRCVQKQAQIFCGLWKM